MKSNKKRIFVVLAILTMAIVLSCALVACTKADTPDAPKKEFTITFDTQGGSEVKPITIAEGATITLPRNPTKEGYIFDGWYLSDEFIEEFNATQTISSNITVYAKWKEDYYSKGLEYDYRYFVDGSSRCILTGIGDCTDTDIIIPSKYNQTLVTSIADYAFQGCTGLTSVTIPNSVTSIGYQAFQDCTGLTSVTIGNSVTSIGAYAFAGCTGLTSVTIGSGVTSIGDEAFAGCTGLTSITIPDNVTSIGKRAFAYCSDLTSITIPDGVTSIGAEAFRNCSSLTSITIPNSVTSIGDYVFLSCTKLTSITFNGTIAQWKAISKVYTWNNNVPATQVICTDGKVSI